VERLDAADAEGRDDGHDESLARSGDAHRLKWLKSVAFWLCCGESLRLPQLDVVRDRPPSHGKSHGQDQTQ
jgi:hypothetical protein